MCVTRCFSVLTLLGPWGAWGDFLVGVDGGFRGQTVELFTADQVNLLEVLHLLLFEEKKTKNNESSTNQLK